MADCKSAEISVSVLVLTRNHEKYISQALDSILEQKCEFKYEILVGDDMSDDRTREIVRAYSQAHPGVFRLFFHEERQGTTKNSYRLMTEARGRYLASCEGDDYWCDPTKLQKQVSFLESHSEYIGCGHKVRLVDEEGKAHRCQYLDWVCRKKDYGLEDFRGIFLPAHSSTLVRRNIFLEPEHDYSIMYKASPWIGDRTSNLLFIAKGRFYKLDGVMSCYRYVARADGGSVTSKLYFSSTAAEADCDYTDALDDYAREELGLDAGFAYHRAELLLTQMKKNLMRPDEKSRELEKRLRAKLEGERLGLLLTRAAANKIKVKAIRKFPGLLFFLNREA